MGNRKCAKVVIIILVLVIGFIAVLAISGVCDSESKIVGNNLITDNYSRGFKEIYYVSAEDARENLVSAEDDVFYSLRDSNVELFFTRNEYQITGYELLIKDNEKYELIGERTIQYAGVYENEPFDWKDTLRADLSASTRKSYQKVINLGEKYEVVPAWGVSTYADLENVTVGGLKLDYIETFEANGENYYFWIMKDVSSIESAIDVAIE